MSTHVLGGAERSRVMVALVTLALAFAVFLLATQAASIWASKGGAQTRPGPAFVATGVGTHAVNGSQIPAGCWVKFGCDRGTASMGSLHSAGAIPEGCRVKFGC